MRLSLGLLQSTWQRNPLARDSAWSLVAVGGRAAASLVTFLILARTLGPAAFGRYAGILAFVTVLLPVTSAGAGHLVIQRVARNPAVLAEAWGNALVAGAVGLGGILATVLVVSPIVLPEVTATLVLVFAAAEFLATSVVEVASQTYTALRRFAASAVVLVLYGLGRVLALLTLLSWQDRLTLPAVAMAYLAVSLLVGLGASAALMTRYTAPQLSLLGGVRAVRDGAKYMLSQVSERLHNDIDKTMLLRAGFAEANGFYSTGYRLVSYAFLPGTALIAASYPRFFTKGAGGVAATAAYARRLALPLGGYALLIGTGLMVGAGLADNLLGDAYGEVTNVIRALAALPLIQGLQVLAANALTGADAHGFRVRAVIAAALANIALNAVLIPRYTWEGAAMATYISEGALLIALLVGIGLRRRRERER